LLAFHCTIVQAWREIARFDGLIELGFGQHDFFTIVERLIGEFIQQEVFVDLPMDACPFLGNYAMTLVFVSVSHPLRNFPVQSCEFRSELLNLRFEIFAFANEAIELSRHARCFLP
jgi:hypothetical protein